MTTYALHTFLTREADPSAADVFTAPLLETMAAYGIDTWLRQVHFLAQVLHESGRLRWLEELWGPTPAQQRYDNHRYLGNTQPGDGYRFRGRGLIQLTGRANYQAYADAIGIDVVRQPHLVAEPPLAADVAGWFWDANGLSRLADADDVRAVTRRINGGTNGLADRRRLLKAAKVHLLPAEPLTPRPPAHF